MDGISSGRSGGKSEQTTQRRNSGAAQQTQGGNGGNNSHQGGSSAGSGPHMGSHDQVSYRGGGHGQQQANSYGQGQQSSSYGRGQQTGSHGRGQQTGSHGQGQQTSSYGQGQQTTAPPVQTTAPPIQTSTPQNQTSTQPTVNPVTSAGNGNETYQIVNNTTHTESFTYSDTSGTPSATITLAPNQTGTFNEPSTDVGDRITPTTASGQSNPDETLFENGAGPGTAQNPDISHVDGGVDAEGNSIDATVSLLNGSRSGANAGDASTDGITAYMYPTDDAHAMGLAGNNASEMQIVWTD